MVNKAIIIGNLGRDPEVKTLPSGKTVCNLVVATSEKWADKNGQAQERTEWHRVKVFGKSAEFCGKYLHKGSKCFVEGRIETTSWEDKDGIKKYATDIIAMNVRFLDAKKESAKPTGGNPFETDFGEAPSFSSKEELPF